MAVLRKPRPAPPMDTQTIETGTGAPIPSKYTGLRGARTFTFSPPPAASLWLLVTGDVGEGKSTFAASVPRALINDFERKYTGIKTLAPGSQVIGDVGANETPWTLDDYAKVWQMLLDDAKAGRRPFDTVVFDTLGGLCDLVKTDFTDKNGGVSSDKPWKDFAHYGVDGAGYGAMNSWIMSWFTKLRNNGYGGIILAHRESRETAEGVTEIKTDGNPGVVKGLYRMAEYSGRLMRRRSVARVQTTKIIGGRQVPQKETAVSYDYVLDLDVMPGEVGARESKRQHVPMEDPVIPVPEGAGWTAFKAAYEASVEARRAEIVGTAQ